MRSDALLEMNNNYHVSLSLWPRMWRMSTSVTSPAFRKTARGVCRLLKLLIYYVSSKASKDTITTDCLEVTRIKRTVHTNSPGCSVRAGCCYFVFLREWYRQVWNRFTALTTKLGHSKAMDGRVWWSHHQRLSKLPLEATLKKTGAI